MNRLRKIAASFGILTVVFGPLLFATPAYASTTIQFTYYWTEQNFTFTDEIVTVVVTNDITNKIGFDGEVIDSYRITLGDQVIEVTEKHAARTYTFEITGTQTLKLEGIDNGFWAGNYGPVMEISSTPLVVPEPNWWAQENWEGESVTLNAPEGWEFAYVRGWYGAPNDWDCGVDVSEIMGTYMLGKTTATIALDNGTFGDPCGGVVKVTRFTWGIVPLSTQTPEPTPTGVPSEEPTPNPTSEPTPTPTNTPTPTPEPTVSPTPEPGPSPTPEPVITPTPEPTPEPTPTPTEEPTVDPTPEPSVEPTEPPTGEPTPAPTQTEEPIVEPTPSEPDPVPTPEPPTTTEESVAVIADLAAVEDPHTLSDSQITELVTAAENVLANTEQGSPEYQQALEALAVAAIADDPQVSEELAAVPVVGAVATAVLESFNALGNVGADMAPAVREEAEKTVIASVIATGAAVQATVSAATAAAAMAAAPSTGGTSGGSSGGSSGGGASASESKPISRRKEQ